MFRMATVSSASSQLEAGAAAVGERPGPEAMESALRILVRAVIRDLIEIERGGESGTVDAARAEDSRLAGRSE